MPEPESQERPKHLISGRFLFNINFVLFSALTSNTVGFLLVIILARALGPEGRGEMVLYQAGVAIGFALFNLGLSSAAFYFVARRELTGREAMEAGATVTLLAAGVTAIAVLVIRFFFSGELAGRDIPYGLAIITIPVLIQLRLTEALLRAAGRFGALNALDVSAPVLMISVFGAIEYFHGLTVPVAVSVWALIFVPLVVAGYLVLGAEVWPRRLGPIGLVRKAVAFGGQTQLSSLIEMLNHRLDAFMILVLVNTAGVGLYSVASSQTEGLLIVSNSVGIVLLTNITSGDARNAATMTPVVCRNTLLVTAVSASVAAVIAAFWIPVVFGAGYQDSVAPYLWLLPGMVAISGTKVLAAYVFSRGKPIINAAISGVSFIVSLPLSYGLISAYGVPGAAMAASIGYGLSLAMTSVAYQRLSGGSIPEALLPNRSDVRLYIDMAASVIARLRRFGRREATAPEAVSAEDGA